MVIIPTVDELTEPTVMRNMRKLAQGVDNNFNEMQTSVDNAVETANNAMEATEGFDDRITDNATAIQNEVTARQNADEAEADARAKADITAIDLAIASGAISVNLSRELGNLTDNVTAPFIKTATLIPSATDRAFKLQFQYWDNTTYTTNDFVIPEGGGTDVSVSGVTVSEGDNENEFKVSIQLDDATSIDSNSYPFPESVTNPYPTAVMLSVGGTTATMLNVDITLSNNQHETGSVDLASLFTDYAKTADVNEQISDVQEQITGLKLSKPTQNQIQLNGDNVNVIDGITGEVVDGKLKLTINGVAGSDIPLPEFDKNYEIEYIDYSTSSLSQEDNYRVTLCKGNVGVGSTKVYIPSNIGVYVMCDSLGITVDGTVYGYTINNSVVINALINGIFKNLPNGNYRVALCVGGTNNCKIIFFGGLTSQLIDITVNNGNVTTSNNNIVVACSTNYIGSTGRFTACYISKSS